MPLPFTRPDALCSSSNLPAIFLKLWQNFLDLCPCLPIALCSNSKSSDQSSMLAVNMVAVTLKGSKGLTTSAAVAPCILCSTLQVGNASEDVQDVPYCF